MNITIKTLTVQVDEKSVPLTKAMVKQLPYLRDIKYTVDQLKCIGDVAFPDEIVYLIQTPDGLTQTRCIPRIELTDGGNIQRFILIK